MVFNRGVLPPPVFEKTRRWDTKKGWYYDKHKFTTEELYRIEFFLHSQLMSKLEWNYDTDSYDICCNNNTLIRFNKLASGRIAFEKTNEMKHNVMFRNVMKLVTSDTLNMII